MKQDVHLAMKFQVKFINMNKDELYMLEAFKEAEKAFNTDEVPVGAIVVINDEIVGRGHNERVKTNKVSSHAEINAIEDAEKRVGSIVLENATIYTTLEPCPMCSYAILESHIKRLVYGATDNKRGAISILDIFNKKLGPKIEVCGNILEERCSLLLKDFFKNKRN